MPGVICFGLFYGLVYSCLRLSISGNLPADEAKSNVYTQTLALGYTPRQPPLYEWLLWLVQQVTGPELPGFLILKYLLLATTFAFLYLVAQRLFRDPRWTALAALSPLMLYQMGWNLHEGVTQTMVLVCAVAGSMWSFMRLAERGTTGAYLLFGLAAGLGLISKYSFAGFLIVLLGSALLQPALRARLLDPRIIASIGASAAVAAPVIYWLMTERHDLVAHYNSSIAKTAASDRLKATAIGLANAVFAPIAFLFPLIFVVVLFPGVLHQGKAALKAGMDPRGFEESSPDWQLLLLHITLGGFLVLIFGAVTTGAAHYLERYMHPFFLLTPLWLLGLLARSGKAERRLAIMWGFLIATIFVALPLRFLNLHHSMGSECRKCRIAVPYEGLARELAARGFRSGTLVAATRDDAGNLRRMFPAARIVRLEDPSYVPPVRAADMSSKVAVVWRRGAKGRLLKEAESEFQRVAGRVPVRPEHVSVPWQPYPPGSRERMWEWMIVVADPSAGARANP